MKRAEGAPDGGVLGARRGHARIPRSVRRPWLLALDRAAGVSCDVLPLTLPIVALVFTILIFAALAPVGRLIAQNPNKRALDARVALDAR